MILISATSCKLLYYNSGNVLGDNMILEVQFLDHYKNDTLIMYNNGCLVFNKVLNVKGQGYAGYYIKVYKRRRDILIFELSDDNIRYSAEAQRKTLKFCKQPLNITFSLNGITQNIKIDSVKQPYLGVEKSGDHLFISWSEEEIVWE